MKPAARLARVLIAHPRVLARGPDARLARLEQALRSGDLSADSAEQAAKEQGIHGYRWYVQQATRQPPARLVP